MDVILLMTINSWAMQPANLSTSEVISIFTPSHRKELILLYGVERISLRSGHLATAIDILADHSLSSGDTVSM